MWLRSAIKGAKYTARWVVAGPRGAIISSPGLVWLLHYAELPGRLPHTGVMLQGSPGWRAKLQNVALEPGGRRK
jgi:hypothetical protein